MSGSDPELQLPIPLPLDGHSGPAARIPQERLTALVETALVHYDRVNGTEPTRHTAAKPQPWVIAAGALLAIAGGAAAARYLWPAGEAKPPIAAPVAPTAPMAPAPRPELEAEPSPAPDSLGPDSAPDVTQPFTQDAEQANERSPERARRSTRAAGAPEDLLQKANQRRAAGHFRDAAHVYSLVYERFPRTQAAYVARVAAGSLELEHLSNPIKARKLFEQALSERPKGALDLEARQGLSVALRDLEDRSGERDALRALIDRHPGSPAARRAQVRLLELGGE